MDWTTQLSCMYMYVHSMFTGCSPHELAHICRIIYFLHGSHSIYSLNTRNQKTKTHRAARLFSTVSPATNFCAITPINDRTSWRTLAAIFFRESAASWRACCDSSFKKIFFPEACSVCGMCARVAMTVARSSKSDQEMCASSCFMPSPRKMNNTSGAAYAP